jgi:threonine synthase
MNRVLRQRGARATIIGATSGDTGAAAIEAFGGQSQVDVFILYPRGPGVRRAAPADDDGRQAQRHALAIEGAFDDCQDIVKALFGDLAFRDEMRLSGVNSINWARILAQIVYYFTSAVALGAPERPCPSPFRPAISATCWPAITPSAWGCRSSASSSPPTRTTFSPARWRAAHTPQGRQATQSPSMDIQVSSNFERLCSRRPGATADALARGWRAQTIRRIRHSARTRSRAIRADFDAERVDEAECAEEMARVYRESGILIDPHTAVGVMPGARRLPPRSGDAGDRARHRPSRQVPRRRRARDRRAAAAAAASRI